MNPAPAIHVLDYRKVFHVGLRRRRFVGADGVSFDVEPNEIFGFLGPNGAGKTTTIKGLLGLVRPTAGTIRIFGHEVGSMAWRSLVGYLPEHPNFYEFLSAHELVTWFGQLAGLGRHEAGTEATRRLERVGLGKAMHRRLRSYSKGMLQRAGLAQALMGAPKLLVLDEPMTGLDPIGRRDVRELLLELKAEGATVFYSTHILPDVEMTCDRVAIVNKGKVARLGRLGDILGETTRGFSLVLGGLAAARQAELAARFPGSSGSAGLLQLELPDEATVREVLALVQPEGAAIQKLEPHRADLETIFLKTLGDDLDRAREEAR